MERHVLEPEIEAAETAIEDEFRTLIEEAKDGLRSLFRTSPPDVKPLILVAMHNLDELRRTKGSQADLTKALKTVQEMTGMKNQQKLLLGFAENMQFKPKPIPSTNEKVLEIEGVEE